MTPETTTDAESPAEPIQIDGRAVLDDAVETHPVVLADFYADWCGPCKMLEPTIERLAAETDAAVAKIDVDVNQPLAQSYGVRGVPTLVLFADGEPVEKLVGVQTDDQLRAVIESYTG